MFMATRQWHANGGLIAYIITIALLYFLESYEFVYPRDLSWLTIALLMSIFGAEFPDLDQLWKRMFNHRDWFLHSCFPGLIILGLVQLTGSREETNILFPILAFFYLGIATHLLLDYFPTWKSGTGKGVDVQDIAYGITYLVDGVTGQELTQKLTGTYLIHFPGFIKKFGASRETLDKKFTRGYLMLNALVLIAMATYALDSFNKFAV